MFFIIIQNRRNKTGCLENISFQWAVMSNQIKIDLYVRKEKQLSLYLLTVSKIFSVRYFNIRAKH